MLVEFDWPLSIMPMVLPSSESKPGTSGRSLGFSVALGSRNLMFATNLRLLASQCVHDLYTENISGCNTTNGLNPRKCPPACYLPVTKSLALYGLLDMTNI